MKRLLVLAAVAALVGASKTSAAQEASSLDYADPALWLCRPGLAKDSCKVDLDATVIAPDGRMTLERHVAAKAPAIDCFYVYPTVSKDAGWISDLDAGDEERDVIRLQFARFSSVCRQFAPIYRQGTLRRLRYPGGGPRPLGEPPAADVGGFADVRDAWNWYMAHENQGRAFVLIGHSQGGAMVARLIAEAIDGKAAQRRMVSAIIAGAPVMVPPDADVGGSFKSTPLCRSKTQTGCVISYATFRDRLPPTAQARFGRARDGLRVACVNPASLAGGSGEPQSYFLTRGYLNGSGGDVSTEWVRPPRPIATHFVKTPGLISTACVRQGPFDYLALRLNIEPKDPRTDELGGQIIRHTGVDLSWGLHLLDMDQAMGSLIAVVRSQAAAFAASKSSQSGR